MALAYTTSGRIGAGSGTGNLSESGFDYGTPGGVVVFVIQTGASTDQVSGVTWGSASLARVPTNGFAVDTAGEAGAVYAYFLGSGIPTGIQTVTVTVSGAATKVAYKQVLTAAADTEVVASGMLQGDQANPQITLNSGAVVAARLAACFSGLAAPTDLTAIAGFQDAGTQQDFGNQVAKNGRQTTPSSGSVAVGWTAASDDVAMVAFAVAEAGAAPTPLPRRPLARLQAANRGSSY